MAQRIVHLCYAGTSGSTRTAVNIAAGSADPARHAYLFYGACDMRADYGAQLDAIGCEWRYTHKARGLPARAYGRVARDLIALQPACVIFHGSRSLPVLWRTHLKKAKFASIAVQHGPSKEVTGWWHRQACIQFAAMTDRTVTVSAGMAELIDKHRGLAEACRPLVVIPNGIDVDYWYAEPLALPTAGPVRLVAVGTLDRRKGHADLLRAVAMLRQAGRNVLCDIVGSGPLVGKLKRLAMKLRIADEVNFLGDVGRDGVRDALHRSHVFCHAALSESFGLAVLEAMAAARAVVATDTVGVADMVSHEQTGLLVPTGEPAAMADAVGRLMDNPQLAADLAAAARQAAGDRYSHARMAEAYEQLADAAIEAKGLAE